MAIAYQYNSDGWYIGPCEDFGLLPHNASYTAPPAPCEGASPRWLNGAWTLAEDWRGLSGWLNGLPHTIDKPGPPPEGFTRERPAPSQDDLFRNLRSMRDAKLAATDFQLMPDYPIAADKLEAVKTYRAALRDLPTQDGAPWDGGGINTPWPQKP